MNPESPAPPDPARPPDGSTPATPVSTTGSSVPFMPAATSHHLLGQRTEHESRRLFQTGLVATVLAMGYFAYTAEVTDSFHLLLGLAIFGLALTPMLLWLRDGGSRFPVFEPMMALCANIYAVPLLTGHRQLAFYPAETLTTAGVAVIAYQLAAIAAYALVRGQPGRSPFWRDSVLSHDAERLISHGILVSTVYMGVAAFTEWIPAEINSVLRAVFNGVSILCTFVAAQRWGRGELAPSERWLFGTALTVQLLIMSSGLLLISAVTLCGIGLLGFLSAGRRVPWVALAALFVSFAVLHNGKSPMRDLYWEQEKPAPTFTELPAFYLEWIEFGLQLPVIGDADAPTATARLLERTSLFHILCLVVHYTPERQPHLEGETYGYVLPQLIPRFFWPEKPRSHIATYRLSTYYGLQDDDATYKTTIAFGLLAEAWANFGILGGIALGLCFGALLKKVQVLSSHSPMFSLAGMMMIILTAWSLNAEHTLAAWISSIFQALIVVLGVPLLLRALSGR